MSSIEFFLVKALDSIVVPPGANIVLALLALALLPFARRLATLVMIAAVGSLYLFSTGFVVKALWGHEYTPVPQGTDLAGAEVIAVPAGGGILLDNEGIPTAGGTTLERLRHAVHLHRRTGLPLLVTGGTVWPGAPALAKLMVRSLKNDFGIDARFVESRSRNTAENAAYSTELLDEAGITRIVLVTHRNHMARTMGAFENQGIEVVPAPIIGWKREGSPGFRKFLPRATALMVSAFHLREWIGRLWYRMRY